MKEATFDDETKFTEVEVVGEKKPYRIYIFTGVIVVAVLIIGFLVFNAASGNSVFRDRGPQLTWSTDMVK